MLKRTFLAIRSLLANRRHEREMKEEMAAHLEQATERFIARGMDPVAARQEAMREFGNVAYHQEEGRNARGSGWLAALLADSRFAVRYFAKSPGSTLVMIAVLGFGIAVSTALYSFERSALTAPPVGVPAMDDIVRIRGISDTQFGRDGRSFYREEIEGFGALDGIFAEVASWTNAAVTAEPLTEGVGPGSAGASFVSSNYARVLGVQPALGTWLPPSGPEDDAAPPAAVLSHFTWSTIFGLRPDIIGQGVRINGVTFTVVGVGARGFRGVDRGINEPTIWLSAEHRALVLPPQPSDEVRYRAAARLRPGVEHTTATTAVSAVTARSVSQDPELGRPTADVVPMESMNEYVDFEEGTLAMTLTLSLIGLLVLLVTCTNVSALLAGRAMSRRREIAVRLSLGAERTRIIRQLLTESMLLAICASLLALGVVSLIMRLPVLVSGTDLGFVPRVDGTAALFTFGIALAVGVGFGLSPALHATRFGLANALKDSTASIASARGSLQKKLVIAQIAFTQPLIVGMVAMMMLLASDMADRRPTEVGEHLVNVSLAFPDDGAAVSTDLNSPSSPALTLRMRQIQQRLEQEPNVAAAMITTYQSETLEMVTVPTEHQLAGGITELSEMGITFVDPRFFEATGLPLVAGRTFTDGDASLGGELVDGAVMIINRDLAEQLWPGASPIGRRLEASVGPEGLRRQVEVVGVIDDPLEGGLMSVGDPEAYMYMTPELAASSGTFRIRTSAPAESLLPALRAAALEAAPLGTAITYLRTRAAVQRDEQRAFLMFTAAFSSGGALALLISALGLYAVVAYAVAQRSGEIAVRMAIGAHRRQIMTRFIGDGFRLSLLGASIGLPLALAILKLGENLEDIPPLPLVPVLIAAGIGTTVVALAATWIPALRAAAVRPAVTLRGE